MKDLLWKISNSRDIKPKDTKTLLVKYMSYIATNDTINPREVSEIEFDSEMAFEEDLDEMIKDNLEELTENDIYLARMCVLNELLKE